ncbi:MAG TPA: hypothetical protein VMV66_02905 [Candidatus Humimicrobiaceae bacterium]|nr:hypothetical protein [Candidatus Humimicrobiaceae bacterium]
MNCPTPSFLEMFLEISTFLLILPIAVVVIYFLVRKFNKTIKFTTFLRTILLYYLCAIILYSISNIFLTSLYLKIARFSIFAIILFTVFYLITRRVFAIDWKKSLAIFLLMSFILFPILDYFRIQIGFNMLILPFLEQRKTQTETWDIQSIIYCSFHPSLYMRIMNNIEGGIASWPRNYLYEIIVSWPEG